MKRVAETRTSMKYEIPLVVLAAHSLRSLLPAKSQGTGTTPPADFEQEVTETTEGRPSSFSVSSVCSCSKELSRL
jgi:hypothetical protein